MKDVLDNPDKPWDWNELSVNPNITMKDVLDNPGNPWNWYYLSQNHFKYDKRLINIHISKMKKLRQRMRSFTLPKWYKLYCLTKTSEFWKWYCGPTTINGGGIGRKIDHQRIISHKYK